MSRALVTPLLLAAVALTALPAQAKVKIVATVGSLGAIARQVGGDLVEVEVLGPVTQDPHFVDAKPSLVLKLNQADLVILTGMELERGWLPPLLVQARNAKIQSGAGNLDASTLISRRMGPAGAIDRSMGDVHVGGNPHYLYDARAGAEVAKGIAQRLAQLDVDHAADYQRRGDDAVKELSAIADAQAKRFAALPDAKRKIVAYHESLPYLLEWLSLTSVATVEPKPGVPPDPGHVAKVLQTMKTTGVHTLVQEEFYPTSTAKTLCELTKSRLVVIDGNTRPDQSYAQYLTKLTDALYASVSQ